MKIKSIKKLTNEKYEIILENFKLITYDEIILKYKLLYLDDIDDELLENIKCDNQFFILYYKAVKYISYRYRSKKELRLYLGNDKFTELVINKLEREKLVDDLIYMRKYILDRVDLSKDGPLKIKRHL